MFFLHVLLNNYSCSIVAKVHKSNVQKFENGKGTLFHKADAFPVLLSITCMNIECCLKILKTCFNSDLDKLTFFTYVYNFSYIFPFSIASSCHPAQDPAEIGQRS